MIPKVVASEIGTAQTLRLPYGLTTRVIKGVATLDKFYAKCIIYNMFGIKSSSVN